MAYLNIIIKKGKRKSCDIGLQLQHNIHLYEVNGYGEEEEGRET